MSRLTALLFLLLPCLAFGQQKQKEPKLISLDTLASATRSGFDLDSWRYIQADAPAMALPGFDDSQWEIINPRMRISEGKSAKKNSYNSFNGIGWFRFHFIADSGIVGMPLALRMSHYGASAIYLDGKLLDTFGHIGTQATTSYRDPQWIPVPFSIASAGPHVLSIRYANFDAQKNYKSIEHNLAGFKVEIGLARHFINGHYLQTKTDAFFAALLFGIFLALALMHLFMYLYYRKFRANLYFFIFCFSISVAFFLNYMNSASPDPHVAYINAYLGFAADVAACIALSGFINELFSKRKTRFIIITMLCLGAFAVWFFDKDYGVNSILVLDMLVPLEAVIVTLIAMFRKVPGARIVGIGVLAFCLFILIIFSATIIFGNININDNTPAGAFFVLLIFAAVLSMPFSMSLYLSWKFAAVNRDLKKQLGQVQVLSDKTLEQERETKRILEDQKEMLEQEVVARTAEVRAQKEVIELKNKSITDNINYAQRIQSAILPDIKLIYKTLSQSFILFLPKDIVSGDFYAFAEKNERVYIIAGDCTGHGVSGAFMSMIGSSLLNQIINEKGISQPALILSSLNGAVIDSLKQTENESHDGMDISLCSFHLADKELQYAGANRPLWLVRDGECIVYQPDKFPIGGLQVARNRIFTNQTVQLQAGDTLYIFTDGYADQFGGTLNKKLMTAKFKEMLLSIQYMSMREQENWLKQYFEQWKGHNEQVDDVLVIGVRI